MQFQWDPEKRERNLRKHGIDFADTESVLDDPMAITVMDDASGEDRYVSVGADTLGRILVLVYTVRRDGARVISARRATTHERRTYQEAS
jgi:uncharacterized DUF497 family protein